MPATAGGRHAFSMIDIDDWTEAAKDGNSGTGLGFSGWEFESIVDVVYHRPEGSAPPRLDVLVMLYNDSTATSCAFYRRTTSSAHSTDDAKWWQVTSVATGGGEPVEAFDMNNHGDIVGRYWDATNSKWIGVRLHFDEASGELDPTIFNPSAGGEIRAINDDGDWVGFDYGLNEPVGVIGLATYLPLPSGALWDGYAALEIAGRNTPSGSAWVGGQVLVSGVGDPVEKIGVWFGSNSIVIADSTDWTVTGITRDGHVCGAYDDGAGDVRAGVWFYDGDGFTPSDWSTCQEFDLLSAYADTVALGMNDDLEIALDNGGLWLWDDTHANDYFAPVHWQVNCPSTGVDGHFIPGAISDSGVLAGSVIRTNDGLRAAPQEPNTLGSMPVVVFPHDSDNSGAWDIREIMAGTSDDDAPVDWIPDDLQAFRGGIYVGSYASAGALPEQHGCTEIGPKGFKIAGNNNDWFDMNESDLVDKYFNSASIREPSNPEHLFWSDFIEAVYTNPEADFAPPESSTGLADTGVRAVTTALRDARFVYALCGNMAGPNEWDDLFVPSCIQPLGIKWGQWIDHQGTNPLIFNKPFYEYDGGTATPGGIYAEEVLYYSWQVSPTHVAVGATFTGTGWTPCGP